MSSPTPLSCVTDRSEVYDRAVGHHSVVSLHHVQLALVVRGVGQAVDAAALAAGTDGHAGDGLVAAHAVHCARPPHTVLRLLRINQSINPVGFNYLTDIFHSIL